MKNDVNISYDINLIWQSIPPLQFTSEITVTPKITEQNTRFEQAVGQTGHGRAAAGRADDQATKTELIRYELMHE